MREIISPISGFPSPFGQRQGFSPFTLFAGGEEGVWYDPSDLTTLFQDTAGTTPVTTPGQTVGLMLDKSKGLTLGPELVTNDYDTYWTSTGNVDVQASQIVFTSSLGDFVDSTIGVVSGTVYEVKFTINGHSSGNIEFRLSGPFTNDMVVSSDGNYSFTATYGGSQGLRIRSATTTSATVSNISVKELPGYHATQSTAAARPKYGIVPETGRRNLLTYSNDFSSGTGGWNTGTVIPLAQNATGPDGEANSAWTLEADGASANSQINKSVTVATSTAHTLSVFVKAGTANFFSFALEGFSTPSGVPRAYFNVSAGTLGTINAGFDGGALIEDCGNGWYRCSATFTTDASDTSGKVYLVVSNADNNASVSDGSNILIYGAQLEIGSTATAYQRVNTDLDVTEAGVLSLGYLSFDGVDDVLVSPSAVFFGEASSMILGAESFAGPGDRTIGTDSTTRGILFSTGQLIGFVNNYTTGSGAVSIFASYPNNRVVSWLRDDPQNSASIRVDGVQRVSTTHDQTDNVSRLLAIGGEPLRYFGKLNFFSLVHIARSINDAELSRTERYIAQKTGVTL